MITISFRYMIRIVEKSTTALNVRDIPVLDTVKTLELLMDETVSTLDLFRKNIYVLNLTSARRKIIGYFYNRHSTLVTRTI